MNEVAKADPIKKFEDIKKIDSDGKEFWEARELMMLLGYETWRTFNKVIDKAIESCKTSNYNFTDHFVDVGKMINIAAGTKKEAIREVQDFKLSRYACYLIAQNGDPRKQEIALAQTYFTVQTRKQELLEELSENEKRLYVREQVKNQNKKLFSTAKQAGVKNFGKFNNLGYEGLYGMTKSKLQSFKRIGKDDVLDRAGATELAANLFRITQTEDKLRNEEIRGEDKAGFTHYNVGKKIRKTIKEIGGTMPEKLSPEKNIKELKKDLKKLKG